MWLAGRLYGGAGQIAYFTGQPWILDALRGKFAGLSAFYLLPENEPPLTAAQLVTIINSMTGGKR